MKTFGLIGHPLGHSFSKNFFTEKFEIEDLNQYQYVNFDLDTIAKFPSIFDQYEEIGGLNCTIPYKQQVMQFLNNIDAEAKEVGAVNTIKIIKTEKGMRLKGFNTDVIGFERSIKPLLKEKHKKAIVLGTGGASKAVKFILKKLGLSYISASIEEELYENEIRYEDIDVNLIKEHLVIINATPLGTYPKVDNCPNIPYEAITEDHVLFDLVYNPALTLFLKNGSDRGATIKNGLEMLQGQAKASWEIWNS